MPIRFDFAEDIERKLFKQIDFALVRTYTKAAQVAQQAIRESLPQRFTLRNNFVLNSIRVEAATKANPTATVYVPTDGKYNADFLVRQEVGGLKTPSGRHLALPTTAVKSKRDIVTRSKRPSVLLDKAKGMSATTRIFKIDESTPSRYRHGLAPGVYQRGGRGVGNKGKRRLKLLFAFEKHANVKARLQFRETGLRAAQKALPQLFAEALSEALRTAR